MIYPCKSITVVPKKTNGGIEYALVVHITNKELREGPTLFNNYKFP